MSASAATWIFPPPGNSSLVPSPGKFEEFAQAQHFLNASAYAPPSGGFGRENAYSGDTMMLSYSFSNSASLGPKYYCITRHPMPEGTTSQLKWESFQYSTDDTLPEPFSYSVPISSSSTDRYDAVWNLSLGNQFSESTVGEGFLCTLAVKTKDSTQFSAPFTFINTPRLNAIGKSAVTFSETYPEGTYKISVPSIVPSTHDGPTNGRSLTGGVIAGIVLGVLGFIAIICLLILCCIRKRKRTQKATVATKDVEGDRDFSTHELNSLPVHEPPPAYEAHSRVAA